MSDTESEIERILYRLFPMNRSITGQANRKTLEVLQELIPLNIIEYPSGTPVYDWKIPDEWNVHEAWIKSRDGNKIVDFNDSNIHVVGYSEPVDEIMDFSDLKPHLHYHETIPEAIPYRTSYYKRDWGFCVNRQQYDFLATDNGPYEVYIDSEFNPDGCLVSGELLISGKSDKEILVSTYICHPSLANDNLSGTVLSAFLARELLQQENLNYSYRMVFVPETIGAISYCAFNEQAMKKIDTGLVITTVGGPGTFGYKQTYDSEHVFNRIIEKVLKDEGEEYITYPFDIHGSDERQYSSQGFRINTASITKDKYYEYPYYHTSLDNLDFVKAEYISRSLDIYLKIINCLDKNKTYRNLVPNCEVMLSKHSLYPQTGGALLPGENLSALDIRLWLLFLCDGNSTLFDISGKIGASLETVYEEAENLVRHGVMECVA